MLFVLIHVKVERSERGLLYVALFFFMKESQSPHDFYTGFELERRRERSKRKKWDRTGETRDF